MNNYFTKNPTSVLSKKRKIVENRTPHTKRQFYFFLIRKPAICIFFLTFLLTSTAQGQIKIDALGRVIAGTNTMSYFDPDTVLTLSLQGKKAINNYAGSKLGFGDFGAWRRRGWNVFIGEYGYTDSDILWLHGKKGIRMTANDGNTIIGEFFCDDSSRVFIRTPLRTSGITISSDDNFKHDIVPITNAMSRLKNLNCKSYTYVFPQSYTLGTEQQGNGTNGNTICQSDKERADSARMSRIEAIRAAGTVNYGFLTSEIENHFPNAVETDANGHKYIDYSGLLPIVVTALQEQQNQIENLQDLTSELRSQIIECCRNRNQPNDDDESDSGKEDSITKSNKQNIYGEPASHQAVLFQNTPNPFTQATTIEYYIPAQASNATIYVFTLNGVLMQSLPITAFGHGQITINASSLAAGMYIYSLVIDGQIVDSKRMILTE